VVSLIVVRKGVQMARLKLQTKSPEFSSIKRYPGKDTYIPGNDPDNFFLLKDNRYEDEKFSRIDKYWVNHYYLIGTQWLHEKIFYPSQYGFDEIENEKHRFLTDLRDRLLKEGIGLYGDRPIPKIEIPVSRLQLKCKPQRMTLSCKEE